MDTSAVRKRYFSLPLSTSLPSLLSLLSLVLCLSLFFFSPVPVSCRPLVHSLNHVLSPFFSPFSHSINLLSQPHSPIFHEMLTKVQNQTETMEEGLGVNNDRKEKRDIKAQGRNKMEEWGIMRLDVLMIGILAQSNDSNTTHEVALALFNMRNVNKRKHN